MVDISKFTITDLPFGERNNHFKPNVKIYEYLGEDGIRNMVSKHYDLLILSEIKEMFPTDPKDLDGAKKRSADFFIQRLGGPEYYKMTRGNPMLANRHLPFKINPKARTIWLDCYRKVLSDLPESVPEELILELWRWLDEFSNWMVNQHAEPDYKLGFSINKK